MSTEARPSEYPETALELRSRTRDLHHQLDRHPCLSGLVREDLSVTGYVTALMALYRTLNLTHHRLHRAFMGGVADHLDGDAQHQLASLLDPNKSFALSALRHDLYAMGEDLSSFDHPPLPHNLGTLPELIGQLYVVIGSSLGATAIDRSLARFHPDKPASYFAQKARTAQQLWPMFLHLSRVAIPMPDCAEAVSAARRQFEAFIASCNLSAYQAQQRLSRA